MAYATPNLIGPEDDGEELFQQPQQQREEINRCTDSNLFSSAAAAATMAAAKQCNSNTHCGQCQSSPEKRSYSECQSRSLRQDKEPKAKRQLLLNEHDGSFKIILPSPEKPPQSSSEWRFSSSSGLAPPPSSPTLRPLPPLVRTGSETSSSVEESLNSCKGFVPTLPPPLDRTFSNNSSSVISVEGSPNSVKGFSPSPLLPPRPPPLRRTVSDPTPAIMTTSAEQNPNSRRSIRRVVDKMKEISQLYEHLVREAEAEAEEQEEYNSSSAPEENIISQPQDKDGAEEDNEERVSVEEVGDCLCIQFRCPCGKGYKILMSGNECYYKLK